MAPAALPPTSMNLPLVARGFLMSLGIVLFGAPSAQAQASSTTASSTTTSSTGSSTLEAPEIDPTLATGMVVLLIGGVLLLTSRHRRSTPRADQR
jgi:uncharacterized membrane protein YfcA